MLDKMALRMYAGWLNFKQEFQSEERGADGIVTAVILVGIAVALAMFFKDEIGDLVEDLIDAASSEAMHITDSI